MKTSARVVALALLVGGCTMGSEGDGVVSPETTSGAGEATTTGSLVTTTTAPATSTTSPATTTTEAEVLNYSQIEGKWAGPIAEAGFGTAWVVAHLESSAAPDRPVGTVQYSGSEDAEEPDCEGQWRAQVVEPPLFEVRETIRSGSCPNGYVHLEYDPETDTLAYEYTSVNLDPRYDATGTLARAEP